MPSVAPSQATASRGVANHPLAVRSPAMTRARIKRTFDLPADLVERMEAAKQTYGVVWAQVVRDAIERELARLQRRTPRPR